MSESTENLTEPVEGNEPLSDILEHLPPEVAEALGKPKAPTPTEEEVTEDAVEDEQEESDPESSEDPTQEEESKDDEGEDDQGGPGEEKAQKRINKLTRKRKEAEAEAEKYRTEAEQLRSELDKRSVIKLEPTPDDPLADIDSMADLDNRISAAKKVRAWALMNPDGASITESDGTERYVDRQEIAKYVAQTEALLTDHAPARKEYLRERENTLPEAKQTYPNLFKAGTPEHKMLTDTLKLVPSLKKLAGFELVIGDAIAGMAQRMERVKAAEGKSKAGVTKGLPKAKVIAPAIPRSGTSLPSSASSKSKASARTNVFNAGDVDALSNYFASA